MYSHLTRLLNRGISQSFIHSLIQEYLFSTCYVIGSILGSANTAVKKIDKILCPHGTCVVMFCPKYIEFKVFLPLSTLYNA